MPKWLREFLVRVGVIAITLTIFAVAIALGFFVSIKLAQGSFWMGVAILFRPIPERPPKMLSPRTVDPLYATIEEFAAKGV
jgi:hypothetical protein